MATFLFWLLVLATCVQETRRETWPGGGPRAEYEVEITPSGEAVQHGPYRSWFEDGTLASEGAYEHGLETGEWTTYHPNGKRASAGRYADGLRSGPWQTFHPDGKPESKGSYVRGTRNGRWTFWDAHGEKDLEASGIYKFEVYRSKGADRHHYRGYRVDNRRQGPWASYWPEVEGEERRVQLEGSYASGRRTGAWTFHHPDGVPSSLLLTGAYVDGVWTQAVALPEPPPFDPRAFPPLEPSPRGWPDERAPLEQGLRAALAARTVDAELAARLESLGGRALPVALELLRTLDPERPEGRAALGFLEDEVLRRLCAGHALSSYGIAGPPDAAAARELLRAWLSLWLVTGGDLDFWEVEVPGPNPSGPAARDLLRDPPLLERDPLHDEEARAALELRRAARAAAAPAPLVAPGEPSAAPAPAGSTRFDGPDASAEPRTPAYRLRSGREKDDVLRRSAAGTKEAVGRALAWLANHQARDGRWSGALFSSECARRGKDLCEGPGNVNYDVGLSALALLAFLGDGHGPNAGPYAETVTRGLAWLVLQQTDEGLIGERTTHDFLYGHLIATATLCEAHGLGAGGLRGAIERALGFVQLARFPEYGWRYDVPATERGDVSMTGWAMHALQAAREAGFEVDPEALAGGLALVERMAEPHTGRVGYTDPGELSSRNSTNEHFPRTLGEAMTAVGLLVRLQSGQRPLTTPALVAHAKLLAAKPPFIDKEYGGDQYYWYYGTWALHEYGVPYWEPWEDEVRKVIVLGQRRQGEAEGSWDPIGPWGAAMGRVGATALLALTLECPYRYPRVLDARR